MEVIPVNFGLKYKPPKLGVQYHLKDQPTAFFVHEIPLSFIQKGSNIEQATKEIIEKNKFYLNPKIVSSNQVRRLVERLMKNLGAEDKENFQGNKNAQKQPVELNIKKGLVNQRQFEMSPTESERSERQVLQNQNQSISRIESVREDEGGHNGGDADLLISDIQQNQSVNRGLEGCDQEDLEQLLKTGAFTKEMMMGQTLRDLGSTIKEAKASFGQNNNQAKEADEEYNDDFEGSQRQINQSNLNNNEEVSQQFIDGGFDGVQQEVQPQQMEEEEEDVIDIDNPDELAAKGLKRIQIEGEEEEYLMDMEGNIYDLRGNFIGTTDGDQMAAGDSQIIMDGDEHFAAEGDEY